MTELAICCTDAHVNYSVRSNRQLIRSVIRGQKPEIRVIEAVKGVTFEVSVGESVGLIGPNGSGKTSLLQSITGLLPLDKGEILVRSVPTFLGIQAVLRPQLTGWRNIQLGLLAQGLNKSEAEDMTSSVADFCELGDFLDLPMETFSSGMKARLHFAVATALAPEILLIDEALAVGDRLFQKKSSEKLEEYRSKAGTILLVSHNLEEVRKSCQRVIWLEGGKIIADGPADDVIEAYEAS
tara:strand:- start:1 stop:717 length:717 start_codon:yes stop_codon:yes gene_type:complete